MTKAKKRKRLTDAEVSEFAKQIYRGELFVSWMMREHDQKHCLSMVFMPLVFLTPEQRQKMIDDKIAHLHARYGRQVPSRAINGYPMFYEMGMWTAEEGQRVNAKLKEIIKTMEAL